MESPIGKNGCVRELLRKHELEERRIRIERAISRTTDRRKLKTLNKAWWRNYFERITWNTTLKAL